MPDKPFQAHTNAFAARTLTHLTIHFAHIDITSQRSLSPRPSANKTRRSIHSPTGTRTFAREGLLYSIPVNDDPRGSLHVSKILRVALPIAFIVVVYTGEPMGILFGRNAFSLIPPLAWFFLLVALGGANAACAFRLVRTESARHLAFWVGLGWCC